MSETKRNHALFSIHDDTIRSALMLIYKIHRDNVNEEGSPMKMEN